MHTHPIRLILVSISCSMLTGVGSIALADTVTPGPVQQSEVPVNADKQVSKQAIKPLRKADKDFLQDAQQACMAAVQSSQLALDRSTNEQVRNYAQRVLEEHTDARNRLDALAEAKGVEVPDAPSLMQRARLIVLSMREGSNFDRHYVGPAAVSAREEAVDLFHKAATGAQDPDIRAFASDTLPLLQHDLDVAKTLQITTQPDEFDQ
jgi:putative membrane protein